VIIKQLLKACYTCEYEGSMDDGVHNKMRFNIRMFAAADMYMISFLKVLAKTKLALQLEPVQLTSGSDDIPGLVGVLRTVYESTSDQTLRNLLFPVLKRRRHDLHKSPEFMALITSGLADGAPAADLFTALVGLTDPKLYYCWNCFPAREYHVDCEKCKRILAYGKDHPSGE